VRGRSGGGWTDVLTGREIPGGAVEVGPLLQTYPVALLVADIVPAG